MVYITDSFTLRFLDNDALKFKIKSIDMGDVEDIIAEARTDREQVIMGICDPDIGECVAEFLELDEDEVYDEFWVNRYTKMDCHDTIIVLEFGYDGQPDEASDLDCYKITAKPRTKKHRKEESV